MRFTGVHIVALFASSLALASPAAASRTDAGPCPVEILEVRLGERVSREVTETIRDHCARFVRDCSFMVDPAWIASAGASAQVKVRAAWPGSPEGQPVSAREGQTVRIECPALRYRRAGEPLLMTVR